MKRILIGLLVLAVLISGCAGPKTATEPTAIKPVPAMTIQAAPTQTMTTQPAPALTTQAAPTKTLTAYPEASVEIKDFAFNPATITISKGTTVIWMQKDSVSHTVTGNGFDSRTLSQGQTFSYTFNEAGTFVYSCSIHPGMKGKVIVT